jgi:gamma-glutamylputrescine oxidase
MAASVTDQYPRDSDGEIIANSAEAPDVSRPRFAAPPLAGDAADNRPVIFILGAGYTGLSAALQLAELRQATGLAVRIILADAGRVGDGPSGKSAGHVCGLQARPDVMERHCGSPLAGSLIAHASGAPALVRRRIAQHEIPCDLRDGYVSIPRSGGQFVETGGSLFGVDPYPYVLGLAFACSDAGVEIHENTEVISILGDADGCTITVGSGSKLRAACVIAAGGDRMTERIPLLRPLRSRTTELKVSTLITDPLPESVLHLIMPLAEGRRYPFANDAPNVGYGSIDRQRRIVFGSNATASRDPDFKAIAQTLHATFPELADAYRKATGYPLGWRPYVSAERLCFTRDLLPNIGVIGEGRRVLYVHALGGQGLAIGTMLGEAAGRKAWWLLSGTAKSDTVFDDFASVHHAWLPRWRPVRQLAASMGLLLLAWN